MPACASPATASPATTATAIGRNSGSTMASAAMANSDPLAITAERNAGPCPGRGAIRVHASSTQTSVGSRLSRPIATHVRRRPNSLTSSTRITGPPPRDVGPTCAPR